MKIVAKIVFFRPLVKLFPIISIALFSYFSLHETLNMFFVGDDFGFVYRMKVLGIYPWPQHQLINMYHPLYNLFHGDPKGYFAVGFIFFVTSAILFYCLAKSIFQNRLYGLIAALIYATSPVGIESTIMMVVYLGTYYALILFNIALIFFLKFLKSGKTLLYIITLIVLAISFETVTYRAFLFPIIMFPFGIFFWNRKKLGIKKLLLSYAIIILLWAFFYLFRLYLLERREYILVNDFSPGNILHQLTIFKNKFISAFPGNGYYDGMVSALINLVHKEPIKALNPILGTVNIVFATSPVKIIPLLHIPLSALLILFSVFTYLKRKKIGINNVKFFFASLVFIFIEVLSFFIPLPRNLMPARDHYAAYALPGYALLLASAYIILIVLLKKQKNVFVKAIPHLLIVVLIGINLYSNQKFLDTYNQRTYYVRPFFKQLKELQPTLPPAPLLIYVETIVNPDDDPAEARWRLYDIWHGGIMGANAIFGVYYNVDANKTMVTRAWDEVEDYVRIDPKNIDKVFGFTYDLDGLHPTTKQVRERLRSLVATGEINR